MPVFEEDPAQLSKSRLKSDLVAHNVTLPTEKSKKDVYVGLYLKHIDAKNAADFSSDEEDQVVEDTPEEKPSAVDMLDVNGLTDDELKASLLKHGLNAGPIVASTRALYERRLLKILQSNMPSEPTVNGAGDANAYSDSEEEGDEEGQDEDSDSNDSRQDDILTLELSPENNKQEGLTVVPTRLYPSAVPIPPGITATCRRPIKGAAGRPVLYKYPDAPPTSPTTLERREVDARLVPVYAQVLVFLAIACLLYLVYACMEENPYHPLLPLLDGLSEALESQEEGPVGLAHPGDPADTPVDL
ncbi:LEM domain-containing protein 1 isoform X3 [Gadus chalcogrammus]|uniref:LEM domain-containing protein 1 isoform X3 n=1 Tax=Gadus chalcogrammus TaxID=1042646 RepID=UPI0024C2A370|nr:LEM domain-containing protein 1 isoform X3 [Gadus chalcogrammus]